MSEQNTGKAERIVLPDLLKGIAVVLMIQVHLTELFAVETWFNSMAGQISLFLGGPPAAPVFMVVMGYFIARGNKNLTQNIKQGLKLILWGLLLNLGMNAHLLFEIATGQMQLNPWTYVFGVDILMLAGLSVLVIALFRWVFSDLIIPWILLMLIIGFLNPYIPPYSGDSLWIPYLQAYFYGYHHWSYFPLFPWAAYPIAGYVFYLLEKKYQIQKMSERWMLFIAMGLLSILVITFNFGFSRSILLSVYYHHDIIFLFWTLAFVVFFTLAIRMFLVENKNLFLNNWLQWIGKNVTSFYVFQWLLIGNIATAIYRSQYFVQLLFWFIFITAASSLMVWLWNKVKSKIRR
ncbi:MAG: hypothetical protein CVT92_04210 [Bacteroidetes bacterium HGW-Bacteroidetes-1]|jgi:uncharacterized membrane protein|nr:MAG: hypothetical protein CVT92_04210 [Bacteroidetes bacterium HGW-Bacteroidetes-1]